eukprot:4768546-Pyramimonas_sp.AAC.1
MWPLKSLISETIVGAHPSLDGMCSAAPPTSETIASPNSAYTGAWSDCWGILGTWRKGVARLLEASETCATYSNAPTSLPASPRCPSMLFPPNAPSLLFEKYTPVVATRLPRQMLSMTFATTLRRCVCVQRPDADIP